MCIKNTQCCVSHKDLPYTGQYQAHEKISSTCKRHATTMFYKSQDLWREMLTYCLMETELIIELYSMCLVIINLTFICIHLLQLHTLFWSLCWTFMYLKKFYDPVVFIFLSLRQFSLSNLHFMRFLHFIYFSSTSLHGSLFLKTLPEICFLEVKLSLPVSLTTKEHNSFISYSIL